MNTIQIAAQEENAAQQSDVVKKLALAEQAKSDLVAQQATAPAVLKAKEKLDATKKALVGKNAPEARVKASEQEAEYNKLAKDEQARQDQIAKTLQVRQAETDELNRQLEILKAESVLSGEQFTAQSDKLARENAAASAEEFNSAWDKKEKETARTTKQALEDRADVMKEKLAAAQDMPVQEAMDNATKLADQAAYAQRMILDPQFRKSEEERVKQKEKNEDDIQKRAERARKAKALGATGKHLDAAIAAGDLALSAKAAKKEADNLAKKQAKDIAATAASIRNVEALLKQNLTLGGTSAGGVY